MIKTLLLIFNLILCYGGKIVTYIPPEANITSLNIISNVCSSNVDIRVGENLSVEVEYGVDSSDKFHFEISSSETSTSGVFDLQLFESKLDSNQYISNIILYIPTTQIIAQIVQNGPNSLTINTKVLNDDISIVNNGGNIYLYQDNSVQLLDSNMTQLINSTVNDASSNSAIAVNSDITQNNSTSVTPVSNNTNTTLTDINDASTIDLTPIVDNNATYAIDPNASTTDNNASSLLNTINTNSTEQNTITTDVSNNVDLTNTNNNVSNSTINDGTTAIVDTNVNNTNNSADGITNVNVVNTSNNTSTEGTTNIVDNAANTTANSTDNTNTNANAGTVEVIPTSTDSIYYKDIFSINKISIENNNSGLICVPNMNNSNTSLYNKNSGIIAISSSIIDTLSIENQLGSVIACNSIANTVTINDVLGTVYMPLVLSSGNISNRNGYIFSNTNQDTNIMSGDYDYESTLSNTDCSNLYPNCNIAYIETFINTPICNLNSDGTLSSLATINNNANIIDWKSSDNDTSTIVNTNSTNNTINSSANNDEGDIISADNTNNNPLIGVSNAVNTAPTLVDEKSSFLQVQSDAGIYFKSIQIISIVFFTILFVLKY